MFPLNPSLPTIKAKCAIANIEALAALYPERVAVSDPLQPDITWRALATSLRQSIDWFNQVDPIKLGPIALLAQSNGDWLKAALGVLAAGRTLCPLDPKESAARLSNALKIVQPSLVLFDAAHQDLAQEAIAIEGRGRALALDELHAHESSCVAPLTSAVAADTDVSIIGFTSGTWGHPKPVEITYGALRSQMGALIDVAGIDESDRVLSMLPMHHMLEFVASVLVPLAAGASIRRLHGALPEPALAEIRRFGITRAVTVPGWLALLQRSLAAQDEPIATSPTNDDSPYRDLAHKRQTYPEIHAQLGPTFRHFVVGGAPLQADVASFFNRVGVPVWEGYGLTEAGPVVTLNTARHHRLGAAGRPLPATRLRIDTDGEILVRGPQVMRGYYGAAASSDVANPDTEGWLRTGDLGYLDDEGYLYLTGRKKSLICLSSGRNIQPEPIEASLGAIPCVREVAVSVIMDKTRQGKTDVCAIVVPNPTKQTPTTGVQHFVEDAVAKLAKNWPADQRPTRIVLRRAPLPRAGTGKLRRQEIVQWLETETGARA